MGGRASFLTSWLLTALLVTANLVVANILLRGVDWRRDLTEDQRFVLGRGTGNILERLEDTVSIKCYFSSDIPKQYAHCERIVIEKLREYEERSGGKVVYSFVDPETDKEAEQECADLGIVAQRVAEVESVTSQRVTSSYMALVFRYGDRKLVLDLFREMPAALEDRARFASDLEYVLTRNIHAVSTERKTVGVLARVQEVPVDPRNPRSEKMKYQGLQTLKGVLSSTYDVVLLDLAEISRGTPIPGDVDVLVVHSPREVSEVGRWSIDQFVMQGGSALFMVDAGTIQSTVRPKATVIGRQRVRDFDLPTWKGEVVDHGVEPLLESYGVRVENEFVEDRSAFRVPFVHDRQLQKNLLGQIVVVPETRNDVLYSWPLVPARDDDGNPLDPEQVDSGQSIFTDRDTVVFTAISPLTILDERLGENRATSRVILRSGPESWTRPIKDEVYSPDPRYRVETTERKRSDLAVVLEGRFRSAFAGLEVPAATGANGDPLPVPQERIDARRDEAPEQVRIAVLGDADCVSDAVMRAAVQMEAGDKQTGNAAILRRKPESMVKFVTNLVDMLAFGDEAKDMFDVKARAISRSRSIREVEDGDEEKTLVDLVVFGLAPGLVIALGLLRWLMRRAFVIRS